MEVSHQNATAKKNKTQDKYWVAFSAIEQIDSRFVQRLFNYFGDIETAFKANKSDLEQIEGLNIKKTQVFLQQREKINPEAVLNKVLERNVDFFTFDDENYPYMLRQISDPPMTLYAKGNLAGCNLNRTLAVVGSRKSSTNAKDILAKILAELGGTDVCVVSGLASGIDTCAHNSAIQNGLKTVGVIASGFDFVYPSSNKALYGQIEQGAGAILSEYYPTFEPFHWRFPQRNRIVSGISYGTLVAEAALKSGALITANLCLEQGRELMCIPGLISNPNTEGIYKLLKQGASMVTCADDILNTLEWEIQSIQQAKLDLSGFSEEESGIISSIEIEPKGFDKISAETGLNFNDLLVALTNLELRGIIKQIEGEKYKLC